jgi:hypothetical protein
MRKVLFILACLSATSVSAAYASNVDFNVGINIGNTPRVAVPVVAQPVYAPPVVIEEPPEFIEPPQLGFYAAVGVPYDLFFVSNRYYLYRGNAWYAAPRYNGPWVTVQYNSLPGKLRRHSFERVRYYRDAGYRQYRGGATPYWKKHYFHPEKEWKEERKAERDQWKRDKHEAKEERKAEREQWKSDRNEAKEERKYERRHGRND